MARRRERAGAAIPDVVGDASRVATTTGLTAADMTLAWRITPIVGLSAPDVRRASMRPWAVRGPITLELSFKHYRAAEILAYLPIVTRVTSHTIRFVGKDMLEVSRFIEFVQTYQPDLSP